MAEERKLTMEKQKQKSKCRRSPKVLAQENKETDGQNDENANDGQKRQ